MADKHNASLQNVPQAKADGTPVSKGADKPLPDPSLPKLAATEKPFLESPMKMGGAVAIALGGLYVLRTVMRK
ncbi:hypothetical protein M3Y96_01063800 [Aphelenchoides besseyi]|nr:hypothetical protein M3Y96_01063800 [Aphelenchoides besseyi]